jgi:lysophospholipase L1-like esterase
LTSQRKFAWIALLAVMVVAVLALRPGHHGSAAQAQGSGVLEHPHAIDAVRRQAAAHAHLRELNAKIMASAPSDSHWIASWAAAPQPASSFSPLAEHGLDNQTLRQVVMVSSPGAAVRIHLSNTYGDRPLVIGAASVALASSYGELNGAAQTLTFGGSDTVVIPPGRTVTSDPVSFGVHALERLALSLYLPVETGVLTYHGAAEQTGFIGGGDQVTNPSADWIGDTTNNWMVIAGVDTLSPSQYVGTVVALGDSITAGFHSTFGAWPDDLARRFSQTQGNRMAVIDEGISGNRVLNSSICCGTSALGRFLPDVLQQSGVRAVVLLEGTNDIGFGVTSGPLSAPHTDVTADQIIAGDEKLIAAAHAAGLKIYGATLLPFKGAFYWTPAGEAKRDAVNDWILHGGAFDGVINFAAVMAEPGHPEVMNPPLNSGDHLHPDNAGYSVMANTVPLTMLTPASSDARRQTGSPRPATGHRADRLTRTFRRNSGGLS